jgi:hypothetical protein
MSQQFVAKRKRYQTQTLPSSFSDEEMARDWTLSNEDREAVLKYRRNSRLYIAIQLCVVRMYGRFLNQVHELSPRIINYLASQLSMPPSLTVEVPQREATYLEHRNNVLTYLGFRRFDSAIESQLETWLSEQTQQSFLPDELFGPAEDYLLSNRILLPGPSVLERLIIHVCSRVHTQIFASIYQQLTPNLRKAIDHLLTVSQGEQRSIFAQLKAYPPSATITSLKAYLARYQAIVETGIDDWPPAVLEPAFIDYLFKLAKRYSARDLKRFNEQKRYAMMVCFLLETRKVLCR